MNQSDHTIDVFNKFGVEYDTWFDSKGKLIFESEVTLLNSLKEYIKHPSIEIGSGSGRFSAELSSDFAIEPSITLRKLSIQNGVIPIIGRGENVPFDDGVFGTVFIIVTLCFSENPGDILKESKRILKDSGYVVLGLVLKDSSWGKFYEEKKEKGHRFYRFAKFYTFSEIKNLLNDTGFKIVDIRSTLFQDPSNIHHIEKPRKGYSKDAGFTTIIASKIK